MNTGVPGQAFPGSDLGMAVQVLENRHGRETMHSTGAGFTLVFVNLATFGPVPLSALLSLYLHFVCGEGGFGGIDDC